MIVFLRSHEGSGLAGTETLLLVLRMEIKRFSSPSNAVSMSVSWEMSRMVMNLQFGYQPGASHFNCPQWSQVYLLQSLGIYKHPSPIQIKSFLREERLLDRDAATWLYGIDPEISDLADGGRSCERVELFQHFGYLFQIRVGSKKRICLEQWREGAILKQNEVSRCALEAQER